MFQVCLLDTEIQSITNTRAVLFAEDRKFSERPMTLLFFVLFDMIFINFFKVGAGLF